MPELPPELEREIFELAFKSSRDITLKVALCLVARRVQVWIDHLLYEMVTLNSPICGEKFLRVIQSNSKPPGFFTVVKRLCLTYSVKCETACGILTACTAVESLACWVDRNRGPKHASELTLLISRLPLRELSIEADHFSNIPATPSSPWLSSLTHITLLSWEDLEESPFSLQALSGLAHLARLTHVCLCDYVDPEHVAMICSNSPQLQVLILLGGSRFLPDLSALDNSPQIVVQARSSHPVDDWEAPYFGGSDVWSWAEATVQQRETLSAGNEEF